MGNILTTAISYNKTDVYVFKDTNNIVTTMCRIKFIEVESFPLTVATNWTITYTTNALNDSKYDVTIEYKPNSVLSDYTLPVYDPSDSTQPITDALLLATFTPVAFIFDSDNVIVTPSASDTNFTVTIVDTNTVVVNTDAFDSAIFRVKDIETEIYGYVRYVNGTIESDVAVTRNEIEAVTENKNFNKRKRVVLQKIPLTKGRWLIEATGSFNCSAASNQVYFWFDEGGLLDELALVPQFKNTLRTFNSGSNTNMTITMQCEFFFEDSTLIYWCTTPDIEIESSIFSNAIPTPSTSNLFIEHAISNSGTNNAKITAISISGV